MKVEIQICPEHDWDRWHCRMIVNLNNRVVWEDTYEAQPTFQILIPGVTTKEDLPITEHLAQAFDQFAAYMRKYPLAKEPSKAEKFFERVRQLLKEAENEA